MQSGCALVDTGAAPDYVSPNAIKRVKHGVKSRPVLTVVFFSAALGACAQGTGAPSMAVLTMPPGGITASLPNLATLGNTPTLAGTVTEVYSRIASKALTCWFSTDGPLKGSHVFSADAPPPSSGGSAEITIFEKDATATNPRGSRAYRMSLTRESDIATRLTVQSGKLSPDLAQAMEKDVLAWGVGKDSCEARVVRPPPPPPPVAEKKLQKKKRVAQTAVQTAAAQASSPATVAKVSATPVPTAGAAEQQPSGQIGPKPAAQPR